jgi:hypothetical protein
MSTLGVALRAVVVTVLALPVLAVAFVVAGLPLALACGVVLALYSVGALAAVEVEREERRRSCSGRSRRPDQSCNQSTRR